MSEAFVTSPELVPYTTASQMAAVGQDVAHIQHAFEFLKPGGRLVSVASRGVPK